MLGAELADVPLLVSKNQLPQLRISSVWIWMTVNRLPLTFKIQQLIYPIERYPTKKESLI